VLKNRIFGWNRWLGLVLSLLLWAMPFSTTQAAAKLSAKSPAKAATKAGGKSSGKVVSKSAAKLGKKAARKLSSSAAAPTRGKALVAGKAQRVSSKASAVASIGKPNSKAARASLAARQHKQVGKVRYIKVKRNGKRVLVRLDPPPPPVVSLGHQIGLQRVDEGLDLKSSVAFVIDQDTNEVLLNKNSRVVLPIASITKLMTAVIVTEARLPMDEMLTVTQEDLEATAGSRSRLALGTQLSRNEMLHLALMSSENRAAHVLGRSFPGGIGAFIVAMNNKAQALGMGDTRFVEPTGLSMNNRSSALDLSRLVRVAHQHPIIRDLSTSLEAVVPVGLQNTQTQFRNTNSLVRNPDWEIGLQKTGYISAAGRCLVMQAQMAGRKLIFVLLDSAGKYSRLGDAERIKTWLAAGPVLPALAGGALAVQAR
jgi:serine-type D-Ala-D-Ala endopeptidase (penicillin-binding protein 7)